MTTRASAPRCASCGMPLAPDAESCAVCGARVPLIARPAEDEVAASGALPAPPTVAGPPAVPYGPSHGAAPGVPEPLGSAPATGPLPVVPASGYARGDDAARAASEVRSAARPSFAPSAGEIPPIGPRVLAHGLDLVAALLVGGVGLAVDRLTGTSVVAGVLGVAFAAAQVVLEGQGGATVGSRVVGLRTVDEGSGRPPGIVAALLRQLLLGLGTLACLVGNWVVAASGAWDKGPRRRGWHDKASGTVVVRAGAAASAAGTAAASSWTPPVPSRTAPTSAGSAPTDAMFAPPPVAAPPTPVAPPRPTTIDPPAPPAGEPVASAPAAEAPAPAAPDLRPPPGLPSWTSPAPAPAQEADLLPPPPPVGAGLHDDLRPVVPAMDDADLAELEHTRVRDPESLRRRTGTLALHFDTGERVRVVGRGLVGRGPRAEDGQDILHVVALQDAARSLSRVHVEFGPAYEDGDVAIWVTDRGSTNGTVVVDLLGTARVLPAGARAVVRAGWTLRLGDREARVEDD